VLLSDNTSDDAHAEAQEKMVKQIELIFSYPQAFLIIV
jgi:hypothetical protein